MNINLLGEVQRILMIAPGNNTLFLNGRIAKRLGRSTDSAIVFLNSPREKKTLFFLFVCSFEKIGYIFIHRRVEKNYRSENKGSNQGEVQVELCNNSFKTTTVYSTFCFCLFICCRFRCCCFFSVNYFLSLCLFVSFNLTYIL